MAKSGNETELLAQLSDLAGILPEYTDNWQRRHLTSATTQRLLLTAMGFDVSTAEKIAAAITRHASSHRPISALLDAYNPLGSTMHVRFNTSKPDRWETSPQKCHVNWIILDSDWEGEFCRVAECQPRVVAYVKNHNLGLEVPYHFGGETRRYVPDFIVLVDDGHGPDDLLRLIVEIKGYRGEDARAKADTMKTYWIPGVNLLKTHGRWAFAEFCDVYQIQADFAAKVAQHFNQMIDNAIHHQPAA